MKQLFNRTAIFHINRYAIFAITLVILIAVGVGVFIWRRGDQPAAAMTTTPKVERSLFSFDTRKAPDWRRGPSNGTSMAVFYKPTDCFASAEYHDGTVDITSVLQENQDDLTKSGYPTTQTAVVPMDLQTSTGVQSYDLHQYSVETPAGASAMYAAHEFGYAQLARGYVKIEAYCTSISDLAATIPALEAFTLTS